MTNLTLPREPEAFTRCFEALFNSGNLAALMQAFEPDAVIHLEDGSVVRGTASIQQVLTGFLSFGLPIAIEQGFCVANGDYAINSHWRLKGKASTGHEIDLEGKTCDVIHRGADGVWRHTIDNPFGTAAAG